MKDLLITIAIAGMLLGGIVWISLPSSPQAIGDSSATPSGTTLIVAGPLHDFGATSMAAGTVSHTYSITNEGTESVTIGKIYSSCMCTSAVLMLGDRSFGPFGMAGHGFIPRVNEPLAPGELARLVVTFDPAAHGPAGVGAISRAVTVEQDGTNPLIVSFTAEVTP